MSLRDRTEIAPPQQTEGKRNNPTIPSTDVFDVLSNERRQYVLHYLIRQDNERVPLRDIVDHVAAWENDVKIGQLNSTERKRVYTAIRQVHLPRLADSGVITYDSIRGEVELTERATELYTYLESDTVPANPWKYSPALIGGWLLIGLGKWIALYPFHHVPWAALFVAGIISFGCLSSVLYIYQNTTSGTTELNDVMRN